MQEETYQMVQHWRELIDQYSIDHGGDPRVLFIEAYGTYEQIARYYEDDAGRARAHFPFNFMLFTKLNETSTANQVKEEIDAWFEAVPAGRVSNWVVSNL